MLSGFSFFIPGIGGLGLIVRFGFVLGGVRGPGRFFGGGFGLGLVLSGVRRGIRGGGFRLFVVFFRVADAVQGVLALEVDGKVVVNPAGNRGVAHGTTGLFRGTELRSHLVLAHAPLR